MDVATRSMRSQARLPTSSVRAMTTVFDEEAGVLRLGHAALSVLARLAVAPTDPDLVDHATAPPLAALRSAGIVGPGGIHPAVRPLAEVMGAPSAVLDVVGESGGALRSARGWVGRDLVVLAVPADDGADAWDLVADARSEAAALVGDLVGLAPAPPVAGASAVKVDEEALAAALAGVPVVPPLPAALGMDLRMRWHVSVRSADGARDGPDAGDDAVDAVSVVDAGAAGLWLAESPPGSHVVRLTATDPAAVRTRLAALLS